MLLFLKVYTDDLTEHSDAGNAMDEDDKEQHCRTVSGQNGEKTGDNEGNMSHLNADDYAMEEDIVTDDCKKQTALDERELLHTCNMKFVQDVKLQTI